MNASSANKRIAKNTLMLYIRMLFAMAVGLYTSRVVLDRLGVDDYGVYNVVGGVVTMFSILTNSMTSAITRFTTYELGTGNLNRLRRIFSTSVTIQMFFSIVIIIFAELIGVWFLNHHLVIPPERLYAANWVLQFSICTFVINLISVPYTASVIAHEHMTAYAYISILDTILKLLVAVSLYVVLFDKLIIYGGLMVVSSLLVRIIYGVYCKRNFEECNYKLLVDRKMLSEMTGFAGWSFMGSLAWLLDNQGINIISNMYFGVRVNSARGITAQVDAVVQQFVNSFMTAINPQITKSYAAGDMQYMHLLICKGAKYSYFLMLIVMFPVLLETDFILNLWLKDVPEFTSAFVKWTFLSSLCIALTNPIITSMFATGNIKKYQIIVGTISLLQFPVTWLFYELGASPISAYVIFFIFFLGFIFLKLYLIKGMIDLDISYFLKNVLINVLLVTLAAFVVPLFFYLSMNPSVYRFFLIFISGIFFSLLSIFYIGLNKSERLFVVNKCKSGFYAFRLYFTKVKIGDHI